VVCCDEVTSAAEPAAARDLQAAVRACFGPGGGCPATVIQVAHSLEAVLGCDGVAVMEGGRVVEAGRPGDLMQRAGSALAGLARAAGKRRKGAVA